MEDNGRRASKRARRPPPRLDNGGDEHSVQQALRKSLIDQKRIINTIPDAPVFHPTVEEFSNVLEYIASIKKAGEAAGIVKIVPPPGWKPTFELRSDNQTFPTKRQLLHKLQEGLPFHEGEEYTQQTYCQKANAFKQQWLQSHPEVNAALQAAIQDEGAPGDNGNAAAKILEEQYWRIVERASQEEVTVDYANDLDTKRYGTGFTEPATAIRPWDLNNLYQQPHSLLAMLDEVVEGVSYPWLYFGMLFSTFCWHNEDHFLYSINYMHEGEGKTWYGVPGTSARRFEEVMRTTAPQRFEQDRDLLHHLTTLTPPTLLMNNGVKVVHTVQHEGEFIVTFPKAYHSGFSLGWNAAEAANFAVMDWLPYGFEAVESYAKGPSRRPAVFSHDKLVWRCCEEVVAALNSDSKQTNGPANTTAKQCSCRPSQMRCLGHAHHGCVCYWPSKILYTHVPDAQLLAMKGLLQSLVKQSSGSTPSDTLMTAMSRLASEHKADRATKDNPHRKRKSAEAFPANNGHTSMAGGLLLPCTAWPSQRRRQPWRAGTLCVRSQQELRSFKNMDQAYTNLALRLLDASEFTYSDRKYMVGIAGVPGSGKSTTAREVCAKINTMRPRLDRHHVAVVVGMDGYHYTRQQLDQFPDPDEAHARRGAYWTFDGAAFVEKMHELRAKGEATLPSFDHGVGDPVPDGVTVIPQNKIILVEGNYLLLDIPPWSKLTKVFNETWYIDCDIDTAMERVLQRQIDHGRTPEVAKWRYFKGLEHKSPDRAGATVQPTF
ncbi:hypothetical protein WJX82_001231 [Trebouxia sp. C0006]